MSSSEYGALIGLVERYLVAVDVGLLAEKRHDAAGSEKEVELKAAVLRRAEEEFVSLHYQLLAAVNEWKAKRADLPSLSG